MTRRLDSVTLQRRAGDKLRRPDRGAVQRVATPGSSSSPPTPTAARAAASTWRPPTRCTREQFGQPIGAFQAVKHQLANMAAELEPSLSLWWYAAHAFDRIRDQSERHAALAKAHMTDVYDRVARDSTELHGGIGFTWEFDLHLWFRRAIFDRGFLGDAAYHRERAASWPAGSDHASRRHVPCPAVNAGAYESPA